MAITAVLFIVASGAITLPLLYFFARKGSGNKPLTSVLITTITSSSISVSAMPVTSGTKKRKGHRASKKVGKKQDIDSSEKIELKLEGKIIAQPESTSKATFSKDKWLSSTLPVLTSISVGVEKQSTHGLEQEIKKEIVEDQVGWEIVGRKGKVVKKQAERQKYLLAAQGEANLDAFQPLADDILDPSSGQDVIDGEVVNSVIEMPANAPSIKTSKLGHKNSTSSIKQSNTSVAIQAVLYTTPAGMNNLGRKDSLESTSSTDKSCTLEEDKKSLASISPITDPLSIFDEKEVAAALEASMAELDDGWKTVSPRRRGQKKSTAAIV